MGEDSSLTKFIVQFGTVFLVILNVLTLLLGIGVLVIGIILQTNDGFIDDDILALLDEISLGGITLKQLIFIVIGIVIALGCFTIVTSLCGGVGALFKLRVLLIIYVIILILCIILELVALGFWIKLLVSLRIQLPQQLLAICRLCGIGVFIINLLVLSVNEALKGEFENLLKNYAGPTATDLYSIGWNVVHIVFGCCGVSPQTSSYNDFQSLPSTWWSGGSRGSDLIPASCCEGATKDNYTNYNNPTCTQSLNGYYTSGCYDVFQELFESLARPAISITCLLVLVESCLKLERCKPHKDVRHPANCKAGAIFFSVFIVYVETKKKKAEVV